MLALDDTARIATDGQHASNASGQWVADGWGGSLAVDAAGKSHVAYSYGAIHPWLQYATNVTGAWGTIAIANPVFSNESFVMPSIGVDSTGRRTVVFVRDAEDATGSLMVISAASGAAWPATPTKLFDGTFSDPDVVVDAAGKVHVAYADWGANAGIWYATNASGSWVRTRVSRSTADWAPSIAMDGAGKLYVAFARAWFAAYPGVYLTTNRSGSWVTYQVDDADSGAPSLALDATVPSIAYADDVAGIRMTTESSGLATSEAAPPAAVNALRDMAQRAGDVPADPGAPSGPPATRVCRARLVTWAGPRPSGARPSPRRAEPGTVRWAAQPRGSRGSYPPPIPGLGMSCTCTFYASSEWIQRRPPDEQSQSLGRQVQGSSPDAGCPSIGDVPPNTSPSRAGRRKAWDRDRLRPANFAVYRAVIARLRPEERFRLETQFGASEMSRREFEDSFPGITASRSYRTGSDSMPNKCCYVVGPPPAASLAFLVR